MQEFRQKQKASFFLFFDALPILDDHFLLPFCYGNRAYFFFFLTKVETFFSSLFIQIIVHLRTAKIELFYRIQILLIKIFKKTLYRYKALILFWFKSKLILRIKIDEPYKKKKPSTQFNVFSEAISNVVFCGLDFSRSFIFRRSSFSLFDG